jgi:hypothetical protein
MGTSDDTRLAVPDIVVLLGLQRSGGALGTRLRSYKYRAIGK